jgi:simple sugar transport system ATP-binding protein
LSPIPPRAVTAWIFISHKLNEVLDIADRITVIRRGKVVGQRRPGETDEQELADLMVGRDVELTVDRGQSHPGAVVLRVEELHASDDRGNPALRGVSLDVRAGEVLGVAGVAGNGQDELVEVIAGLRRASKGRVLLGDTDVTRFSTREMNEAGCGFVPADRHRFGLVLSFPVADNLVLTSYHREPFSRGGLWHEGAVEEAGEALVEQFDVRTPSVDVDAATLSGGNQQKVIVAREFSRQLRLILLDQPTRGLDVGSVETIHRLIVSKRDEGTAVLLVSAELDEILELSDRIAVLFRGRLVGMLDGRTADRNEVGLLMATGGSDATSQSRAGSAA